MTVGAVRVRRERREGGGNGGSVREVEGEVEVEGEGEGEGEGERQGYSCTTHSQAPCDEAAQTREGRPSPTGVVLHRRLGCHLEGCPTESCSSLQRRLDRG